MSNLHIKVAQFPIKKGSVTVLNVENDENYNVSNNKKKVIGTKHFMRGQSWKFGSKSVVFSVVSSIFLSRSGDKKKLLRKPGPKVIAR